MKKIVEFFKKRYDFDRSEINRYDYIAAGIFAGFVLTSLSMFGAQLIILAILMHLSFKK